MTINEKDYALWLFNVTGIGNASIDRLLCAGISCRDVYEMNSAELSGFLSKKQVASLEKSRFCWDFEEERKKLEKRGIRFVPRIDSEFPDKLKDIPNAPFAIYVKGKLPDPGKPSVSIVGARMCSEYGRYLAKQFGRGLALCGVQVISGMARGIDGIAQSAALGAGGTSFGILGCGVDICYPPDNRAVYDELMKNGGVISEYPPGTEPVASFFPVRNRIISALSDVLLVVEARHKSGTQITVDTALEQGREVLAVPGRITDRLSDGCNFLISQGAGVALSVEDVMERLISIKRCYSSGEKERLTVKLYEEEEEAYCEKAGGRDEGTYCKRADVKERETYYEREDGEGEREKTIEEEILDIVDIIPVSTSHILEELYRRGKDISVPILMTVLMEMTYSGEIIQNGTYYRKTA